LHYTPVKTLKNKNFRSFQEYNIFL